MDCTRSAKRLGAESVTCVYRRRQADMTALPEEAQGAIAEGCELATLQAPVRIEADENDNVVALWVQPQIVGPIDSSGRPRPLKADAPEKRIPCDIVVVAIGQGVETQPFEEYGVPIHRGAIEALSSSDIENFNGIFAGGDCVTGPATVIRAIAAGKVAAANIDEYLGFNHAITCDVEIPAPALYDRSATGRVNLTERPAQERNRDFEVLECGMTEQEALQEAHRCLRCDHFGYGAFKGGRVKQW